MNHQTDEIMTIMQEECGEIIVAISKCKRFGLHTLIPDSKETNTKRLTKELGDLFAMVDLLIDQKLLTMNEINEYKEEKFTKLKKWSNIKINK
jgi:NTP pyrophosphatase (non-canonical NTP hydrolase)